MGVTRRSAVAAMAAATVLSPRVVLGQSWPERPITLVVPFAPGGGTDVLARILAPALSESIGGTVVIETVSGAAGNMGSARTARAAPDGYTLLLHNVGFAINAALYRNLPFDSETDLVPIAFVSDSPLVILGRKTIPATTLPELITWMKTSPMPAKLAHAGVGSASHFGIVPLARAAGRGDMIPYRGGGPAVQDVIAGHADLTASPLQAAVGPAQEGLAKAFAVTSAERAAMLPSVASLGEVLGPKALTNFWSVLMTRAGTPAAVTDKVRVALEAALVQPALLAAFDKAGVTVAAKQYRDEAGARALLRKEIAHWAEIVRDNGIEAP
ncbi:Bug family tripartite tricarboxylate transporter substrate binding protein [Rhodoplanes elegans]|uniref:Bug family tripartite tricarboxylate transporter substrate binding protein n=1 Tax=Rhodoplanes elegans TaxID=29408 RepID=UPI00147280AA|nr:tripartite tricarboxylate transporter substrate-binding protein [Rhodoplanes elegans]